MGKRMLPSRLYFILFKEMRKGGVVGTMTQS